MEYLLISALTIGTLHALAPDHWVPFVALARAQQWSKSRTIIAVLLAGLGHVGSSVVIGLAGIAVGAAAEHVTGWESVRGNVASLLLIGFGLGYMVWGVKKIVQGSSHHHEHGSARTASYWTLFILIIFGPCEPLIPLLFASSAFGWMNVVLVVALFSAATLVMMQIQVHAALWGVSLFRSHVVERASDAMAGAVIVITGLAIRYFGI